MNLQRWRSGVLRFALFLVALAAVRPAGAKIRYTISLAHPEQNIFHIAMQVPNAGHELIVAMPAWNATYDIRDFAYRVSDVQAFAGACAFRVPCAGKYSPLRVEKLDKQTWKITDPSAADKNLGSVTVVYDDFWNEPGPFDSQLNAHHAFLNLAEVLFYIPTRRAEKSEVAYQDLPSGWRIAEELPAGNEQDSFAAESYDALVDAPAEIGAFQEFSLPATNAHFRVVVDGKDWSQAELSDALEKIVTYETGMMRETPFREYTFFFHFGPYAEAGGGGMEHSNCTAIAVPSGEAAPAVAAHEFFHLWNVKRIRPQTLQPVDYTKEMWTRALWFAEGVTSTYASFTMVRAGLWDRARFYQYLGQQFTGLEMRPAHLWQSAEESSLDTWLDKYSYYNEPQISISYYNKGQILGVMLDLAIRDATGNRRSLDDVMRAMDADYAHRGKFYDDSAGVEQEVERVSGRSFKDFFAKYVAGTEEIPYNYFLSAAGLQAKPEGRDVADLGFTISRGADGTFTVSSVTPGSGAEKAGLQSGDAILQFDGRPFGGAAMRFLSQYAPGATVTARIRRNGDTRDLSFALGKRTIQVYSISEIPDATERQKRIREGLLKGTTDEP